MKFALIFSILLFVVGCGHTPTKPCVAKIETITVNMPVTVVPKELKEIPTFSRPILRTDLLTKQDAADPDKVLRALAIDVYNLRNHVENLESNEALYRYYVNKFPTEVDVKNTEASK